MSLKERIASESHDTHRRMQLLEELQKIDGFVESRINAIRLIVECPGQAPAELPALFSQVNPSPVGAMREKHLSQGLLVLFEEYREALCRELGLEPATPIPTDQ